MRIFDLHCDTASKIYRKQSDFSDKDLQVNFQYLSEFDEYFQVFAMWVDAKKQKDNKKYVSDMIGYFSKEIKKHPDPRYLISIEGGEALENDVENVNYFFSKGVKIITPVWNYENLIGVPSCISDFGGISPFGRRVIERMNGLNMSVDLSHINLQGFFECVEIAERPIVTHSNSYAVCKNKRNITDEQFCIIKQKNGIIGINFYPYFLNNTDSATVKDIIKHIYHFLSLGGENNICIGSDFDGIDCFVKGFENIMGYNVLIEEMLKLNFLEEIIAKITYINCKNYMNDYIK